MPMLFALGQHGALAAIQGRMRVGEHVFAYQDDISTVSRPTRVDRLHVAAEEELWAHARDLGRTQVWNKRGTEPSGVEAMTRAARAWKPGAVVWRGDPVQQGLKVLGVPICISWRPSRPNNRSSLSASGERPTSSVPPPSHVRGLKANFWLRALRLENTETFARRHDDNVWTCLRQILGTPNALAAAHIHWASWADSLRMVRQRHPSIAERMVAGLVGDDLVVCIHSVRQCRQAVLEAGLEVARVGRQPPTPRRETRAHSTEGRLATASNQEVGAEVRPRGGVQPALGDSARALVRLQHGPLASAPLPLSRRPRPPVWMPNRSGFSCA